MVSRKKLHHLPRHWCESDQLVVPQTLLLPALLEDRSDIWFTPPMDSMHRKRVSMPISTLCSPLTLLKQISSPETSPSGTKHPGLVVMLLKIPVQCPLHCPHITFRNTKWRKTTKEKNISEPESFTKFQGWKKKLCSALDASNSIATASY